MAEKPTSVAAGNPVPASPDAAYLALHAEREALEHELLRLQQRQRFAEDATIVEEAREREAVLLQSLDHLLTRIRAAEYQRKPGAKRW